MRERITPIVPKDQVCREPGGNFKGSGYFFKDLNGSRFVVEVPFDVHPVAPLDPFRYNKPIPNADDPTGAPWYFQLDQEPRIGYYPLAIVEDVRRGPNHLYETDDGLLTAVNMGTTEEPKWETRYFPRRCLPRKEVWQQAVALINDPRNKNV